MPLIYNVYIFMRNSKNVIMFVNHGICFCKYRWLIFHMSHDMSTSYISGGEKISQVGVLKYDFYS